MYEFVDNSHIAIFETEITDKIICGYLKNSKAEALPFATIYTDNTQTETDINGYFEFQLKQNDKGLTCQYIGYSNLEIQINNKTLRDCDNYLMLSDENQLETVLITEYIDDGIGLSADANAVVLNIDKMQILPGSIEEDPLTALLFLPGVSNPSESLDAINIRGGTNDQNLLLWDDIPIFQSSHMFGSVSGLNPFIIDEVEVYRNGVSSRYGGRVSSVIDIKSRNEIPKKVKYNFGSNMMQAHLGLETPLWKNSALFITGRFSLTNLWSSPAFISYAEKVFQGSKVDVLTLDNSQNAVRFSDFTFKWIYNTNKNRFTISSIASGNEVDYRTAIPESFAFVQDDLVVGQGGVKFGWERDWSKKISSEVVLTSTEYDNKYGISVRSLILQDSVFASGQYANRLSEGVFRMGLNWEITPKRKLRFGLQYTNDNINLSLTRNEPNNKSMSIERFKNQLVSFYSEYSMQVQDLLSLDMGLRINNSQQINNSFVEPRVSVTTNLTKNIKLKLSTSKNFQFLSQLVVFDRNDLGLENQSWIAANDSIVPVIEANQWTGGLLFTKGTWTIDVDAYVKEINGLTSLNTSLTTSNVPYSIGNARIRGLDVLVKKRFGNYRSWISYTLSRVNYEFNRISLDPFLASHDNTHSFRWAHLYKYGRFNFSAGFQMRTGLPYTPALGIAENKIVYDEINSQRLKNYFRLDASVVYQLVKNKKYSGTISASIQNAFGQTNILSRQYFRPVAGETELIIRDRVGLGLTPNIGIHFDF